MYEWYIQKDGKVRRMSELQLRAELRKDKLTGLELARRADQQLWTPLHDAPLYSEEVAFEGAPQDHARLKVVRGFGIHFLIYLAVNVMIGFAAPVFLFWGIGIVVHGARAFPAAQALYRDGKFPYLSSAAVQRALPPSPPGERPKFGMGGQPPRFGFAPKPEGRPVTAPQPAVAPLPGGVATPPTPADVGATNADPYAPTGALPAGDPSASSSMAYEPTVGVGASRNVQDRQLHAAVAGRLFGQDAAPPVQIGRYRLQDQVGQGGMGLVYRAHDESLDRTVALKLLRSEIDTSTGTERLQREARSMAKVSHPNVVTVYDVGTYEGAVFVAMEFVQGRTLRAWLEDARGVGDILAILRQAGEGLAAAHAGGLVHRDFKPENVIVGDDGRVRVLDFGLAKPVDETTTQDMLTRTGTVLGTPRYMTPEQFRGEPADALSDQFALGVVVYEALYGVHPYQPPDEMPLPRSVLKGRLRQAGARADVPAAVRDAVTRAVAHDPDDRHPSVRAMLDAFGPTPTTSDELASLAAAVRRLLTRRAAAESGAMLAALDSIETVVAELDAKAAALSVQMQHDVDDQLSRELDEARASLAAAEGDADRALLSQQIAALEQRKSGMDRAREVIATLRTRRSIAENQLKQLHLDLTRAEASDTVLPDLTGPLQELRFQVDAAQEVEALLASRH
ncbi:MAG: protein kinase [Myxococcota bacterium]